MNSFANCIFHAIWHFLSGCCCSFSQCRTQRPNRGPDFIVFLPSLAVRRCSGGPDLYCDRRLEGEAVPAAPAGAVQCALLSCTMHCSAAQLLSCSAAQLLSCSAARYCQLYLPVFCISLDLSSSLK